MEKHKMMLRTNTHHSIILQRAYNKYGIEAFNYTIIENCEEEVIIERENYYIVSLEPKYNICREAYSCKGYKHTDEAKAKISAYAKANNVKPPITNRKGIIMLDYNTGKELKTFDSVCQALTEIGIPINTASTLSMVCNGKRNSAYGYKWKWKNK